MKAIVIVGASLRISPYALPYIYELLNAGYDVTTVVWIRDGNEDITIDSRVNLVQYKRTLDDATPKLGKIGSFLGFRRFMLKEIRKCKYDLVVILNTQFAVLISDVILKDFKGKFIYDMRDMSYEHIKPYRDRVAKIVDSAAAVFISSDGYRKYLPDDPKIYTTHNYRPQDLEYIGLRSKSPRKHDPIRISFWGIIRGKTLQKKLINILRNDERFHLDYYGTMSNETKDLVEFCSKEGIKNVSFHGRYEPNDRYIFAANTEIINNLFSNPDNGSNPLMANKYYDGLIFQIPQICLVGGFMGSMVEKNGVGLTVNVDEKLGDVLYQYYSSIRWETFSANTKVELKRVVDEYEASRNVLFNIIGGRK